MTSTTVTPRIAAAALERGPHRPARLRVEAGGRFVEHQDRPRAGERGAERSQPALASGELTDDPAGQRPEAQLVDERVTRGARRPPDPARAAVPVVSIARLTVRSARAASCCGR